jgi:hypothetical protein
MTPRSRTSCAGALLTFAFVTTSADFRADDEPVARIDGLESPLPAGDQWKVTARVPAPGDAIEGPLSSQRLDLRDREDLVRLRAIVGKLAALAERQDAHAEAHPERHLPFDPDLDSKGKRLALRQLAILLDRQLAAPRAPDPVRMRHVLELFHAIHNGFRYPVERSHQLVPEVFPLLWLEMKSRRMVARAPMAVDADPPPSTFWSDPGVIAAKDLYRGFDRGALPSIDTSDCTYAKPKTGWGAHPGFEVKCGDAEVRFKLGNEIYGGPFNTRIFDALGYHTIPIDTAPALRVRYDRRVLSQYNSRRLLAMHVKLLFVRLFSHTITDVEDPFDRIDHAVLRDGSRLPGRELRAALLKDGRILKDHPRPETLESNYRPEVEREITHLAWQPGTMAWESDDLRPIGPWDYDQLDHADRREVRAVFVLGAWLDQFNMRWENTRLAYEKREDGWVLRHLFSDVGSGLGVARSLREGRNSDVDAMLWEVTERKADGRVRFSSYYPNVMNDAFRALTAEDARWMLRKIGSLRERQILDALLATHMSAAEVRLALEKLLSKRRRMIEDFGLFGEFPEIARRAIDRQLDFDPREAAQLERVSIDDGGRRIAPRIGSLVVRDGRLVQAD